MEKIRVYCKNTQKFHEVEPGTTLYALMQELGVNALAAHVDNQLKELGYKLFMAHSIEFIDYTHSDGRRCYKRSLFFILQKAIKDLYPDKQLILDYTLPNGNYGELTQIPVSDNPDDSMKIRMETVYEPSEEEISIIKRRMQEIVEANFPIEKKKLRVITQLINGEINGTQAAEKLGITTRQVRNLKRQVLNEGRDGVIHKNKN